MYNPIDKLPRRFQPLAYFVAFFVVASLIAGAVAFWINYPNVHLWK